MGAEIEVVMKDASSLTGWISARMLIALCAATLTLVFADSASAQAPAGPISGAPDKSQPPAGIARRSGGGDIYRGKLAGDWKLDRARSDDPRQKMEQATGSSRGHVGTNGPWGGVGGGGHRGTGPGSPSARAERQASEMLDDFSFLSIAQTETTVRVTSDRGRLLAYYSSGEHANTQAKSAGDSQGSAQGKSQSADGDGSKGPSTRMQGDQLVVVSTRDGVKTTRTYAGTADGSQLYLTSRIEGGHLKDPVTIRFVYTPAATEDEDIP
jgi:hypothetical protein